MKKSILNKIILFVVITEIVDAFRAVKLDNGVS